MRKNKLIIYELNEVPEKVLFDFIRKFPNSTLKNFIDNGFFIRTETLDKGELHPWSTWPTVYRGITNDIHSIKYINQDLSKINKEFPNVWNILEKKGLKIGIFGSLQSYPPLNSDNVKFYIPDTFSPESNCFPSNLNIFQEFNLQLCNENKAISKKISFKSLILFIRLCLSGKISFSSIARIFLHVILEKINPNFRKKRAFIQAIINFDLYKKLLQKNNIDFSTFFTNHVAATMHRYWKDAYGYSERTSYKNKFSSKLIMQSMELVDKQIKFLNNYSKKNNYDLWIISSMGQDSINRGTYIPETTLKNFEKLIEGLSLKINSYKLMPAMQPDICIKCKSYNALNNLKIAIRDLTDFDNNYLLNYRYKTDSLSINLSITTSQSLYKNKKLIYKKKSYRLQEFGFELITRDPGTAYHIKEGIFLGNNDNKKFLKNLNKETLNTTFIFKLILDFFEINHPKYIK